MGRRFLRCLAEPGERAYCCGVCKAHLAAADALVSRAFHARSGRAYLFAAVHNVTAGPEEPRVLTSGLYVVSDCRCVCGAAVGWKYVSSPADQEYKTDKFCLERAAVVDLIESDGAAGPQELSPADTDGEDEEEGDGGTASVSGLAAMVGAWGWPAAAAAAVGTTRGGSALR
jgi:hypothetical protein